MIQQVCLKQHSDDIFQDYNWQEPMELMMNAKDYKALKKTIKTLFDRKSVKIIKKLSKS